MATSVKRRPRRAWRWLRRLAWLGIALIAITVLQVAVLRFVDPPFSAFMAARQFEAWGNGEWDFRIAHDWRDLDGISPHVPVAVIAAEDQRGRSPVTEHAHEQRHRLEIGNAHRRRLRPHRVAQRPQEVEDR